jgi:soluble lytic murein transglycosylase-like protein
MTAVNGGAGDLGIPASAMEDAEDASDASSSSADASSGATDASAAVEAASASWTAHASDTTAALVSINAAAAVTAPRPSPGDARVLQYKAQIIASAAKYGVPAALVAAVIARESSGDPNALSLDGGHGKGLMQLDDRSQPFARGPNAFDPAANIDAGTAVLAADLKAFPGNPRAGIAAYNAGVTGVRRAIAEGQDPSSATYVAGYVDDVIRNEAHLSAFF